MEFKSIYFNTIQNHIFQSHYKSYISMEFKSIYLNEIIIWIDRTPLFEAIEEKENEIVKLLLENDKIDVNILYISQLF